MDKGFVLIDVKGEESGSCEFKHLEGGLLCAPIRGCSSEEAFCHDG